MLERELFVQLVSQERESIESLLISLTDPSDFFFFSSFISLGV